MDKGKLKNFAGEARKRLIDHTGARIRYILTRDTPELAAKADLKEKLRAAWENTPDRDEFIERHAYTLFNRLIALRYMDVKGYNFVPVVSPRVEGGDPAILADARKGLLPAGLPVDQSRVKALLSGEVPAVNPFNEAYKLLFIAACAGFNKTMPFMFEPLNSYTEILLPDDLLSANSILAFVNENLGEEECENVEVIGWLYQFYISEKKDVLIKRKTKYSTPEIPFVTQLFTPRWMVEYITQNSLGRFWLEARRNSGIRSAMQFFIEPTEGNPFIDRNLDSPEKITILDPACGSGHMLVYAFELLYKMYEEEGYYKNDIPAKILQNNLFGLEIDERATALAKFALLMKGMEYDRNLITKGIEPHIYCFFDDETDELFRHGKTLGSLIPVDEGELFTSSKEKLKGFEDSQDRSRDQIIKILKTKHDILITNPPYVNGSYFNDTLKKFVTKNYKDFGSDLFSVFIVKGFNLVKPDGYLGFVTPFVWMFISSYEKLRKKVLAEKTFISLVRPSYTAFFESAIVPLTAFIFNNSIKSDSEGVYFDLDYLGNGDEQVPRLLDGIYNPDSKRRFLQKQSNFSKIPGAPIAYWVSERFVAIFSHNKLKDAGKASEGIKTGNNDKYLRFWFEVDNLKLYVNPDLDKYWVPHHKGGEFRRWFGNNEYVINYKNNGAALKAEPNAGFQGKNLYWKQIISWSKITSSKFSCRMVEENQLFDSGSPSYLPNDKSQYNGIIGYLNTKITNVILRMLNPTLNLQVGNVENLPFLEEGNDQIDRLVTDSISISREDWDARETSWDFQASPLLTAGDSPLLEERYAAYKAYWSEKFHQLHRNEEELNRIFIEIYGLQDELTPDVALEDVTILQPEKIITPAGELDFKTEEVVKQFISYAVGCMFGRYSLDKPGLILANQGETLQDYLARVPEPRFLPDEDNIIPVLDDEYFEDDMVFRFHRFLEAALGKEGFSRNLNFIEGALGMDLRRYFNTKFYEDHLRRYKKRPIYWMVSSPGGSFKALIYMHRYNSQTMSKLFNDYLKEYRSKLAARLKDLHDGITRGANPVREEDRLNRAIKDTDDLILAITPLAMSPVAIDLDDGVKANLAKFKNVVVQAK